MIMKCFSFILEQPRITRLVMLITMLLLQSGCSSLQLWLGWRVKLAEIPVTSMSARIDNGPGIAPGFNAALIVSITQPDGHVLQTEGAGKGKIRWSDLAVSSTLVNVNAKGVVTLNDDPTISEGQTGHIVITIPSHPGIRAELDVPVHYTASFTADFSGQRGRNGKDGDNGIDGAMGSMGSLDPNSPSPGGNGGNGTDGTNGEDGAPGDDALPVYVIITLRHSAARPLLQVFTANQTQQKLFLIDPDGGSLTVRADGGPGGFGGHGGRGGQGGPGGAGTPPGARGIDGMNGRDGFSGKQGKGARITVIYDRRVLPYLGVIHLSSSNGPPPAYEQQQVKSLW